MIHQRAQSSGRDYASDDEQKRSRVNQESGKFPIVGDPLALLTRSDR